MQGIIKVILNLFSRKFLIKISLILKPFFELIFRGDRFVDPINNKSYSYFFPYGYNKLRKNALSPGTLSLERHRLLWIFLEKETDFFNTENKYYTLLPNNVFIKVSRKTLSHIQPVILIHQLLKLRLMFVTCHLMKMNLTLYCVITF